MKQSSVDACFLVLRVYSSEYHGTSADAYFDNDDGDDDHITYNTHHTSSR
jgi:hypothetical protein